MDKIGVVTVTFNSEEVIDDFMKSLLAQTHENFSLFVIDNASKDGTLAKFKNWPESRLTVVTNQINMGVAAGNNQGIKLALEAGCDFILLINNDTVFEQDLLSKLLQVIKQMSCSIATPKMMYYLSPDTIWYAGGFFYKRNGYIPHHRGINEKDIAQYNYLEKVDYAPTCCTLIKKEVFADIGLMDEKYFVYADDTDFFYRIWKDGRHIMFYVPWIEFYHKVGSLTKSKRGNPESQYGEFYIKYTTRNNIYYLKKQRSIYSIFYIVYYYLKINLSFWITGRWQRNIKTFLLLQQSFWEGLFY
jgi:GT2 family glycosyltransferase